MGRISARIAKAKLPSEDSRKIVDDLRGDRSNLAKPNAIFSAFGIDEPRPKFESSGAALGQLGSFVDVKPPPKQSVKPLAFDKPTLGEDVLAKNRDMQGSGTDGKPKSGQGIGGDVRGGFDRAGPPREPTFKPLAFHKPTFGAEFFADHRVATGKKRDRDEGASASVASSSRPCGSTSVTPSLTPHPNGNGQYRGLGFRSGLGFNQPTKEEVDDFIAFVDKIIPSIKRPKMDEGGERLKKGTNAQNNIY